MTQNENRKNKRNTNFLVDSRIDVKIIIAALWVSQFLIWTFGDMMSLLQNLDEPASNVLLGFVAAPLGILQVSMILYALAGKPNVIRWANFIVTPIFIVFNIGFMLEAKFGWEFVLGTGYLAINALILGYAWKWPRIKENREGVIL